MSNVRPVGSTPQPITPPANVGVSSAGGDDTRTIEISTEPAISFTYPAEASSSLNKSMVKFEVAGAAQRQTLVCEADNHVLSLIQRECDKYSHAVQIAHEAAIEGSFRECYALVANCLPLTFCLSLIDILRSDGHRSEEPVRDMSSLKKPVSKAAHDGLMDLKQKVGIGSNACDFVKALLGSGNEQLAFYGIVLITEPIRAKVQNDLVVVYKRGDFSDKVRHFAFEFLYGDRQAKVLAGLA